MFFMPNIVVVDNDEVELNKIKEAFFDSGLPCLPIQYINDDPDNESGIDHVSIPKEVSPRIVVLDLNLTEQQNATPANLVAPMAEVIKKLSVNGPYLLCIWSKLEKDVEEVVTILEERYEREITFPIHWNVISKSRFISGGEDLKEKVRGLISESKLFESLLAWEAKVSEAARKTNDTLFEIAASLSDKRTISSRSQQLQAIMAVIANESIGHQNAVEQPALAMNNGLSPILYDQLSAMPDNEDDVLWRAALPKLGERESLVDPVKSRLNSFYHIEEVSRDSPKNIRGVFVLLDKSYLNENQDKFKIRIGRDIKEIIHDEFLNPQGASRAERRKARESVKLGFLEVSAACDYAQRKTKLPRYILGALIPIEYERLTFFSDKPIRHNGIFRLPNVSVGGEPYVVKFSFKYQFGAQPEDNKWFGESVFRVRDQILSNVVFSCSTYSSRPGVMSFS